MGKKAMNGLHYILLLIILLAAVLIAGYFMFVETGVEEEELKGELGTFGIGGEEITLSATRTMKGSSVFNAIDNDLTTIWDSGSRMPARLTIEFDSEKSAVGYTISCQGNAGGMYGKVIFYDLEDNLILYDDFFNCVEDRGVSKTFDPGFVIKRAVIEARSSGDFIQISEFDLITA